MRIPSVFFFCFGVTFCILSCGEAKPPENTGLTQKVNALGKVLALESGQPVADARVSLLSDEDIATMTNESGVFVLEGVPAGGEVVLKASKDGFLFALGFPVTSQPNQDISGEDVWLRTIDASRYMAAMLQPAGLALDANISAVAGIVQDSKGNPVFGASISGDFAGRAVMGPYYFDDQGGFSTSLAATSHNGRFIFLDTGVLEAQITAAAAGFTFSPRKVYSLTGALSYGLVRAATTPRSVTIRGSVKDMFSNEIRSGVKVSLTEDPTISAVSSLDGSFTLQNITSGRTVVLVAQALGFVKSAWFPLVVSGDLSGETAVARTIDEEKMRMLAFDAGVAIGINAGAIVGKVLDRGGAPVSGAAITIQGAPSASGPHYTDETGAVKRDLSSTTSSGFFVIFNVPPGDYSLAVLSQGYTFPAGFPVRVITGAVSTGILRSTNAAAGVTVSGTVRHFAGDGTGVKGVKVWAAGRERVVSTTTNSGAFSIFGVPFDSTVTLTASMEDCTKSLSFPFKVGRENVRGAELRILCKAMMDALTEYSGITLRAGGATVAGLVRNASGQPLTGVKMIMSPEPGFDPTGYSNGPYYFGSSGVVDKRLTETETNGLFVFFNVPAQTDVELLPLKYDLEFEAARIKLPADVFAYGELKAVE